MRNMTAIEHPSTRLDPAISAELSAFAHSAEMARDLHPKQLDLLYRHNWFRMFIPKIYDGLGLALPDVVRLEEALAWADGSTAWVATLCGGAGWFSGFVDPAIATEFFTGNKLCVAGSGSATGIAEMNDNGYIINGSWPFASGALHATTFTANCLIKKNGQQVLSKDGTPRVLPFILRPCEVVIKHTWNATGMISTGSHAFSVANLQVPANRCFSIHPSAVKIEDPVYRFPFLQLAEVTLAANISGMSVRFIDLAAGETSPDNNHDDSDVYKKMKAWTRRLNVLRQSFFAHLDNAWQVLIVHGQVIDDVLQQVSEISRLLVRECREAIDEIYPLCQLNCSETESALNRVYRNLHTALTHALFRKQATSQ